MRARTLLAAMTTALLATPTTASAGGWWSWIDVPDALGVGETVTAEAQVSFPDGTTTDEAAGAGGFHAYLLRDLDQQMLDAGMSQPYRSDWWAPPTHRIWLAEVELSGRDGYSATATATFEVPAVAPGVYAFMLCTLDCAEAMGDVVPRTYLRVYAEPTTAGVAREVTAVSDRLVQETERVLLEVEEARGDLALSIGRTATRTRERIDELEESVDSLAATVSALPPPGEEPAPWTQHAGWYVAGLATAAAVAARRRRRDAPAEPEFATVPDDAGELVTGPPVPMSSIRR